MREGPLDDVAPFVRVLVEWMFPLARRVLFDDRRGSPVGEESPERLAVVGSVREQRLRRRKWFDQSRGRLDVVAIAAGQFEGDDPAVAVNDGMDFGRAPTPALADGLLLGPPFPPAEQRCAFAVVLSMH
jgi:hypothetical protein